MPAGSRPGERRGGRKAGTPDKATVARQADLDAALADAFAAYGPDFIDNLSPAQYQNLAWKAAAKAGHHRSALAMAEKAAPYFDAKPAPKPPEDTKSDEENAIIITGGLPSD